MSEQFAGGDVDAQMSSEASAAMLATIRAELAQAREALDRQRELEKMLRGELQHRVRNVLAVTRSIFARSVDTAATLEDLANHFQGRLDVLARYQFSRLHEPSGSADLETMICDELQSFYAAADPRIALSGPEMRLGHDAALAIGLALHELATNSIKFGVLGAADGRGKLRIEWRNDGERLRICWDETGIPILASAPLRSGFGREFIEQALPYQIGAETRFALKPGGLCCEIGIPLGAAEGGAA
jgi:two-component sensor histidine kinase